MAGVPEPETLAELRQGMHFSDGFFHFQKIRSLKRKGRSAFLELELREGKNREIRRLLARVGHKVMHLERIAFGPLRIGKLDVGEYRELRSKELSDLYAFIQTAPHVRNSPKPRRQKPAPGKKRKPRNETKQQAESGKSRRGAARHGSVKKTAASNRSSKGANKGKAGRGRKK